MWHWIKRWRDWAMHDLWPLYRIGPQSQALGYSFEKAGLTLHNQPIPWNAEAVLVEAQLRPGEAARRKGDYELRLTGADPLPADSPVSAITVGYAETDVPVLGWPVNWLALFLVLSIAFAFALRKPLGVTL